MLSEAKKGKKGLPDAIKSPKTKIHVAQDASINSVVVNKLASLYKIRNCEKIEKTINLSTDDNLFTTRPHSINNVDRIKKISKKDADDILNADILFACSDF